MLAAGFALCACLVLSILAPAATDVLLSKAVTRPSLLELALSQREPSRAGASGAASVRFAREAAPEAPAGSDDDSSSGSGSEEMSPECERMMNTFLMVRASRTCGLLFLSSSLYILL